MTVAMAELYDVIGIDYHRLRRPDPRIAAHVGAALGTARSVLNVGAGAGSYEPRDRRVVAVEPSRTMIRQRPPDAAPVVQATGTALPVRDAAFDAALAVLTLHHWPDQERGCARAGARGAAGGDPHLGSLRPTLLVARLSARDPRRRSPHLSVARLVRAHPRAAARP